MKHGCLQIVPCEGHGKMKMCVQLRKFQGKEVPKCQLWFYFTVSTIISERYIVLHAGNKDGFIEDASLIFKSKKNSLDYHSEMNAETFEQWLQDVLLIKLQQPSVIILDNASYHSRLEEKRPTSAWRKADLQCWLQKNNISYPDIAKKDYLLALCKQHFKGPVYAVDQIIHAAGHDVIRLPPYYLHL
jgi:hypothetical protein